MVIRVGLALALCGCVSAGQEQQVRDLKLCKEKEFASVIRQVLPDFPPGVPTGVARLTVTLGVLIDDAGNPQDIKVLVPNLPPLEKEAIGAVEQWRFKPATCEKQVVATRVTIEVNFRRPTADKGMDIVEEGRIHYNMGVQYYLGKDIERDLKKAIELLEKSDQFGFPDAPRVLALMYQRGEGVPRDLEKAASLAAKSAKAGSVRGQLLYAQYLRDGTGLTANPAESAKWYRKAANAGLADAMRGYASMLDEGTGVKRDPAEAAKWRARAESAKSQ